MTRLEHANISVTDVDATTRFITTAMPGFAVRGEGLDRAGRLWRHVGDQHNYVALQAASHNPRREVYGDSVGMNHLGWHVDDLNALEARMEAAGFTPTLQEQAHPARRRTYYDDPDGNEWEFIEYLTDDVDARNRYDV